MNKVFDTKFQFVGIVFVYLAKDLTINRPEKALIR